VVEEIKMLLPLLEQATKAAVWLVAALLVKNAALAVFWGLVLFYGVRMVVRSVAVNSRCHQLVVELHRMKRPSSTADIYLMSSEVSEVERYLREKGAL
jgi:hypothetical protein